MKFIDPDIESYCIDKSRNPSRNCERIKEYTLKKEHWSQMLTGEMEASFLCFFIKLIQAKRVLEFGTYTGYSTLAMAESLGPNGEVITLDKDSRTMEIAQKFWSQSGHGYKIKPYVGEAIQVMDSIPGKFDFVFIDADKLNYKKYLDFSLERLSAKGMIAIDNVLWSGKVLGEANDSSTLAIKEVNNYLKSRDDLQVALVPIRDGIFLVQKINKGL